MISTNTHALTRDEAQIRSNLNSFSTLADQSAFEYLGRLFAEDVVVDYTSLFGGEPQSVKREALMQQWAGLLPGFDTTYHELSNTKVKISGNQALATSNFTASHWLGNDGFWSVSGEYQFSLIKNQGNWVFTSLKAIGKAEKGNREVLGKAAQNAESNLKQRNDHLVSYQ